MTKPKYYMYEPPMFNTDYRRYVSDIEKSKIVKSISFDGDLRHPVDYYNQYPSTFSSVVKNSNEYPRWSYNPIKPYEQKQMKGSPLIQRIENAPVYWGSHKYTVKNCPKLSIHSE